MKWKVREKKVECEMCIREKKESKNVYKLRTGRIVKFFLWNLFYLMEILKIQNIFIYFNNLYAFKKDIKIQISWGKC